MSGLIDWESCTVRNGRACHRDGSAAEHRPEAGTHRGTRQARRQPHQNWRSSWNSAKPRCAG